MDKRKTEEQVTVDTVRFRCKAFALDFAKGWQKTIALFHLRIFIDVETLQNANERKGKRKEQKEGTRGK